MCFQEEGQDLRQQLAEQNMGLAYMLANEFEGCGIEFDDLVSICFLGLVKAANRFDENREIKFATFAVPVMRNEVLLELRRMRRRNTGKCISLDAETEDGCLIAEIIPDQKDMFSEIYASDIYTECIGMLSEKEKAVIIPLVFGDETQEQVSNRLSISQSYVSRIHKRAKEKLKKVI